MRLYRLAALAAFALSLHAQTTVTGPVVDTTGATWGGKITLRATSVVCPTGILGPSLKTIPVVGGVFSQVLCPGIYSVRYQGTNASRSAYWTVPDTGPVIIKEIESGAMPTPLIQFSYSLISGLAPGDLIYGSAVGMARLPAPANGAYSIQWTNGVPSYVAGGGGTAITGAPGAWPSFATVATSGSYADLSGRPVLGGVAALNIGATSGTVAAGDDARLANARAPTAHAASHATGGGDVITPASIGAQAAGSMVLTNAEYDNGTCTTAKTINPNNGNRQKITLTNAQTCALSFTQPVGSTVSIQLKVIQSAAGLFNGTISGGRWPGGATPTITATTGAVDILSCYLDGAAAHCVATADFR